MENFKKTLLLVALLVVAKPVQASTGAAQAGSWLSGAVSSITAAGTAALPALGAIGTAAASALIPFGLGPIATIAAPYIIAAGANYVTKKVSGVDLAQVKYQEELKDEVGRLTRMMERRDRKYARVMNKMRKLRRSRKRRESKFEDEMEDEVEDYDDEDDLNCEEDYE